MPRAPQPDSAFDAHLSPIPELMAMKKVDVATIEAARRALRQPVGQLNQKRKHVRWCSGFVDNDEPRTTNDERRYFANGSGRSWNFTSALRASVPPSMCHTRL